MSSATRWLVLLFAALLPAVAHAGDGFRCTNGRLVLEGSRTAEVLTVCRAPDFADRHIEVRTIVSERHEQHGKEVRVIRDEYQVEVVVDDWMYDLGKNRFVRFLRFEDGVLVDVKDGPRGNR